MLGIFILTIVLYSFKYDIGPIVWSLYLQAILFILSNFNIYRAKNYNNYIGLNNLASMFSVVFTVTNTLLASMVSEQVIQSYVITTVIFIGTLLTLIYQDFDFEDVTEHTT